MKKEERIGQTFGFLEVQSVDGDYYVCRCICGKQHRVYIWNLSGGKVRSCGCKKMEVIKAKVTRHGLSHTPEHDTWCGINKRCNNPNHKDHYRYGGRGIRVCDRWLVFENFLADMGRRPSDKHSIERVDLNGNYEPSNCTWILMSKQASNTRRNIIVDVNGVEMIIKDAAAMLKIDYGTLVRRFRISSEKSFIHSDGSIVTLVRDPDPDSYKRWLAAKNNRRRKLRVEPLRYEIS